MKAHVQQLITAALSSLQNSGQLPELPDESLLVHVERTRDRGHGDFASNIAMALAKQVRRKPRDLAEQIVAALPPSPRISQVEIAGPGFINVFLSVGAYHEVIKDILAQGQHYGRSDLGGGRRVQVEFVSANPTGPLHVGHGRGAAFGATIADLLEAVGFSVQREYYVNDAGRQMDILATSVWLRYLEQCGETLVFPVNGYKGVYIREIAAKLYQEHKAAYAAPVAEIMTGVPPDEPQGGDKEQHIDALIERAKVFLGNERYRYIFELGLNSILDDIREDLEEFGVRYDQWYSERSLTESGAVNRVIEQLRGSDHIYKQDGALWFRASAFGDEKDRVVQRENGQTTYFASDIAYHAEKFERGFERVIDVWGADHHGYITRTKAALSALDHDPAKLDILLVQFAILYRGGVRAQMSTRAGEFVSLRDLRQEVGNDAARFFYVMRKSEQHLDFDLDLAKSHSKDNPVYYIQYAHARVCSVLARLNDKGLTRDEAQGHANLGLLDTPHEEVLLVALSRYPEVLEAAALKHDPHQLAHYLRDLANAFHTYYNEHRVLLEEPALRNARLNLSLAVRQVIHNGLTLLGVSAPEAM